MGIVLLLIAGAVGGAWLAYRNSALLRACREMDQAVRGVGDVARRSREARDRPQVELQEEITSFLHAQRESLRRRIPLESLRDRVEGRVQWAALQRAGYSSLSQLARADASELLRVKGVGPATAIRILEAAREVEREVLSRPVGLPGPRMAGAGDAEVVRAALQAHDARELLGELPEALRRQHESLHAQARKVRSQASFLHWLFVATGGIEKSPVYQATRSCVEASERARKGRDATAATDAIRTLEHRAQVMGDASVLGVRFAENRDAVLGILSRGIQEPASGRPSAVGVSGTRHPAAGRPEAPDVRTPQPATRPPPASRPAPRGPPPLPSVRATPPARPAASPAAPSGAWLPPGTSVRVQGYDIPGGMIYVGDRLPAHADPSAPDPALINPRLAIDRHAPDWDGEEMHYWPSYSHISRASRAAYLHWLSSGRSDPRAYIGYVFLFYYGLERRLLLDGPAGRVGTAEATALRDEIARLLGIYGDNGSFHGYASNFLAILDLTGDRDPADEDPPESSSRGWELPMALRLGLGRYVAGARPIPPRWARAWVLQHPETYLRTPATRCAEEFGRLFDLRYQQQFGEGLVLKPNRKMLEGRYRPASSSFHGQTIEVATKLPDVGALTAPVRRLREIVESCSDALDSYSRFVGRNPGESGTLRALALLPPELISHATHAPARRLSDRATAALGDADSAPVRVSELLEGLVDPVKGQYSKQDSAHVCRLLQSMGFGLEPDVRFGSHRLSSAGHAVLFRVAGEAADAPSSSYAGAALLVHLAAAVAAADGDVSAAEQRHLEEHLGTALQLPDAEAARLKAYMAWALLDPPSLSGLAHRLRKLEPSQKELAGRFMVGVACADGRVDPGEIRMLTKIYKLLDLDPAAVHREIHAATSGGGEPVDSPVIVRRASPDDRGYPIQPEPGEPSDVAAGGGSVRLDRDLIRRREAETAAVSRQLASILMEDEPPVQAIAAPADTVPVGSLDGPHSALLRSLQGRESWSRSEFDELAQGLQVLPDGALDVLNEAALEEVDELVLEGEDPLLVNTDVLTQMIAGAAV